jgi:hypothetical protein
MCGVQKNVTPQLQTAEIALQNQFFYLIIYCLLQAEEIGRYFEEQVGEDLPKPIAAQLDALKARISSM